MHEEATTTTTYYPTFEVTMSVCVSCEKPLVHELEPEEDEDVQMEGASSSGKAPAAEPETVPDDVQLNCGCHFHWYTLSSFSPKKAHINPTVQAMSPRSLRNNRMSELRRKYLNYLFHPRSPSPLHVAQ
jgi:hypothetical protein